MDIILLAGAIFGSVGGAFNASNQQTKINNNICQIKDTMLQQLNNFQSTEDVYSSEYQVQKAQVAGLNKKIIILNQDTQIAHDEFKKTYTYFLVGGISLLIILIFILATKKIILRESAMQK